MPKINRICFLMRKKEAEDRSSEASSFFFQLKAAKTGKKARFARLKLKFAPFVTKRSKSAQHHGMTNPVMMITYPESYSTESACDLE